MRNARSFPIVSSAAALGAWAAVSWAPAAAQQPAPWAGNPLLKRAFVAGYGVSTDVEPPVSEEDRKILDAIQPVIETSREDAIASLAKFVDDKTNARFDLILANLYLEKQNLRKAVEHFRKALVKFPNFRAAHKNLGMAYAQGQAFDKAIESFAQAIRLGESDGAMFGLLGQCHLSLGNETEAETAFRQAAMMQPSVADWKRGNIAALVKQGRVPDAIAQVETMIAKDPDNADLLRQQSQLYVASEQPLKAAELLEMLALREQATGEDLYRLGDLYVNAKLGEPALAAYTRAMSVSDDPARVIRAAEVMGGTGAVGEAESLLKALRAKLGEGMAADVKKRLLKVNAKIAAARNATEESAAILREITETDPLDGDAWMLLGRYHQDKQEVERAIFAYERAAALEAFKADANVRLAQIFVQRQEFAKAMPLLEEAQRLKPRDSVARYLDQVKLLARAER